MWNKILNSYWGEFILEMVFGMIITFLYLLIPSAIFLFFITHLEYFTSPIS
jgi:hypothetical protein